MKISKFQNVKWRCGNVKCKNEKYENVKMKIWKYENEEWKLKVWKCGNANKTRIKL